ncbi:CdaR family protein [Maribacter sp. X9]|uniref:CdaR family protein n=1 Tax=Maribacter sp. X9 TaxID=3402159 RepID=UPI003AF36CC8
MKLFVEWIKTGLKKRKVKVFLLFLLCATLAWLINKLSQQYTSNTIFHITYVNIPKEFILANTPKKEIQVRLRAVGFQFLGYGLKPKKINLDVSKVMHRDNTYYLTEDQIQIQLEAQLNNNSTLVDFDGDLIYFDFTSLESKKVPVKAVVDLTFSNNHILEGELILSPDSIKVTGPKSQIDTIQKIETKLFKRNNLNNSFSTAVPLNLPSNLNATNFSPQNITIEGTIVKFSEQVVKVPVSVINLPKDVKVRTFPEIVEVRCQGTLERLKELEVEDFFVVANYLNVSKENGNRLPITLERYPKSLNNAFLNTNEIEFILRRE